MLLIFKQKIIFIPALFLEILQRYYKLIILGTLGTFGHTHQKQWHKPVENFYVYLQTKSQLDPSIFFTGITLYMVLQSAIGQEHFRKKL